MNKKLSALILTATVLFVPFSTAQEPVHRPVLQGGPPVPALPTLHPSTVPAPALSICAADFNLWASELRDPQKGKKVLDSLSFKELQERRERLASCVLAYPQRQFPPHVPFSYTMQEEKRLVDFMVRHNLVDQFIQEDEAGQR
ncbi:MAG: hypothetical protein WBB89_18840 [Candidatus Acidiferrum sp.]